MTPRATYRMQFHKNFTFADAEAQVPYLAALGISHLYASPIATARSGSTHGYDVVDPTRINPELGGEAGFRRLVDRLKAHGMGMIVDIVPNHMGVAGGENGWWNDVLANGASSTHAPFFDIDWREPVLLPILGDPVSVAIAQGALSVELVDDVPMLVAYGEHRLPLRPEDHATATSDDLTALLDRQHYRLASWRTANDDLNWRRFFTINDLAGLRAEDPVVFEASHRLYLDLYAEGLIDGVRVDHVDGLTDPAGYCRTLRANFDAITPAGADPAYIVVEKILAAGEPLATDWGIDGTSGYDFMAQVTALLHDEDGAAPLAELWADISGRSAAFEPEDLRARQDMLSWQFEGQLGRCVAAFVALARSTPQGDGLTAGMIRRAVERMLWVFPVYRTYGTGIAAPAADAAIRAIVRERVATHLAPGEGPVVDLILDWLAGEGPGDPDLAAAAVRRFQQLSAPIVAKAVEDTAFYRYGRLLSRNDVGFDPAAFALPVEAFHAAMAERAACWPRAMLASATHDHKRGEDVRARLAVLSEIPGRWRETVTGWVAAAAAIDDAVDPGDAYMLLQTLFGAWPEGHQIDDRPGLAAFAERIVGWQEKSLREAKLRSSWEAPDEAYEDRCHVLARALLDPDRSARFLRELHDLVEATAAAAQANALVQTALRYTVPGVPDLYQGTELADLSLVDPDNRRPVDYARRARLLEHDAPAKLGLIARLLATRADAPEIFARGDYAPLDVTGPRAAHVLAFERRANGQTLRVAVALRCAAKLLDQSGAAVPAAWWGETRLATGERAADLFVDGPVFVAVSN
ncbi:malto-oligosyltrehalose synthase [Sphingomonas sp. CFBP 13733]|uniref:malto-oligosyltrehalose synthase n=1 Tax=Sphingomonas sp. CFBP 13733 TaxID=2775291 RepID=UPI0017837A46|nr:malto-oligosyltrehalose synthase [Sphingomonas sp. CFBP 13733]MBD8638345.1 malto-oligosyltrehalose synthase [Sphingomonas sp. CFBP 13733]